MSSPEAFLSLPLKPEISKFNPEDTLGSAVLASRFTRASDASPLLSDPNIGPHVLSTSYNLLKLAETLCGGIWRRLEILNDTEITSHGNESSVTTKSLTMTRGASQIPLFDINIMAKRYLQEAMTDAEQVDSGPFVLLVTGILNRSILLLGSPPKKNKDGPGLGTAPGRQRSTYPIIPKDIS